MIHRRLFAALEKDFERLVKEAPKGAEVRKAKVNLCKIGNCIEYSIQGPYSLARAINIFVEKNDIDETKELENGISDGSGS